MEFEGIEKSVRGLVGIVVCKETLVFLILMKREWNSFASQMPYEMESHILIPPDSKDDLKFDLSVCSFWRWFAEFCGNWNSNPFFFLVSNE